MSATAIVGAIVGFLFLQGLMGFFWWYLKKLGERKPNANNGNKSAGLTALEWKNEIRAAVKDMLIETAPKRHEDLRRLMTEVFEHEFLKRNDKLASLIAEAVHEGIEEYKRNR